MPGVFPCSGFMHKFHTFALFLLMKECIHNKYILNGELHDCSSFDPCHLDEGISIYEVIRVINGRLLFLEDHYERLKTSLSLSGQTFTPELTEFTRLLQILLDANKLPEGNIKIVINFKPDADHCFLMYYIPHRYPSDKEYQEGVTLNTFQFVREEPNKKIWRSEFRKKVKELTASGLVYEILLVSPQGFITEASRANIFFLKGNTLFTSPVGTVLPGITRKHIFTICHQLKIELFEKTILKNELGNFNGAFITGTSPKVLPVKQIDDTGYIVGHELINRLMKAFDELTEEYIRNKNQSSVMV